MSHKQHITGIYPGTFDPMTYGHLDVLIRSSNIVDKLVVGIATAYGKNAMFLPAERKEIAELYISKLDLPKNNVQVMLFDGLLVNFAKEINANLIIRGRRAVSDFEYEFQMSCMNRRLDSNIETIFLPATEKNQFISSRLVKQIAALGGDITDFVSEEVARLIGRG